MINDSKGSLSYSDTSIVTGSNRCEDFISPYKTAKTPWIVSQPLNREGLDNTTDRKLWEKCIKLFRFHAIDDGKSGNNYRVDIKPQN